MRTLSDATLLILAAASSQEMWLSTIIAAVIAVAVRIAEDAEQGKEE